MNVQSENGVVCTQQAWSGSGDVVLEVPVHLLNALQAAWQADDNRGTDFGQIVTAVRDLFDGEDGALQFLAQIGVETRPT